MKPRAGGRPPGWDASVPERFEEVVKTAPEGAAIRSRERTVTFAELDRMSDRIAGTAARVDPSSEAPVFLLFEDVTVVIAAMLACLKLGRPYVPLSATMPVARLDHIRSDAEGTLLLSDNASELLASEIAGGSLPVLLFEDCAASAAPPRQIQRDACAWILYTSGSTGQPKGVIQTQRNLMHYVSVYTEGQELTASDRISLLSSYTANIASHDIFSALLNGATVCPYEVPRLGIASLADWIEESRISVFSCVPTLFRQFAQGLDGSHAFESVRFVKLIGEPVYRRDFDAFLAHFPPTSTFVNRLGSSETGTIRWLFADASTFFEGPNVPVGYDVHDNKIEVVDESGRPVAEGDVGEIVVQGPYLSPGYWNRPDLTDAAYQGDGETRRFRTGDLGRMLPDGCLVHVGRKDAQIKIRGYRIEIAEVEAALLRHPALKDVLVMPREDHEDTRCLAAYYVTHDGHEQPTTTALRGLCASVLPEYMIPNAFVPLEAFPLAPNGKIQRSALPPVGPERPILDTPYEPPQTAIQSDLVELWKQLLHLEKVGIRDNFLDLGGHSLLATRFLARVRERYEQDISMRDFFGHPVIENLAAMLETEQASAGDMQALRNRVSTEPPILKQRTSRGGSVGPSQAGGRRALPLSFAQERLWFIEQLEPDSPVYNVVWALDVEGPLSIPLLQQSVDFLVARHDVLRTSYGEKEGIPFQRVEDPSSVPIRAIDLALYPVSDRDEICERLLARMAVTSFRLDRSPMLRALVLHHRTDRHSVLLASHHIATDGWSKRLIAQELSMAYDAFARGEEPEFEDLPFQYADYALAQRESMEQPRMIRSLEYWKRQLAGLPDSLSLPSDRTRAAEPDYRGESCPVQLPESLSEQLEASARALRVTSFMLLAAGWTSLLSRYSQQDDIALGFPIAGRLRPGTEELVGFFANTLVLRIQLGTNPTFRELVEQVRRTCLDAYDHQEIPFERIVSEIQPHRERSQTPLFQVMFAFANMPNPTVSLGAARAHPLALDTHVAKFDLRLNLSKEGTQVKGTLDYRTQLFDRWRIEQMARHFLQLLNVALSSPDSRIHEIDFLSGEERHGQQMRALGSRLAVPTETLDEILRRQAKSVPNSAAVADDLTSLTYKQLDRRATVLATVLRQMGVSQRDHVGLCLPESVDCYAALLGIVRAGAIYVPMSPYDPVGRLGDLVKAARPRVLVSSRNWQCKLETLDVPILFVDELNEDAVRTGNLADPPSTSPDGCAYVLFTSGSTGTPKGVAVTHRNAVSYAAGIQSALNLPDGATFLWLQPLTADTSLTTLLGALYCAGCVQVIHPRDRVDAHAIERRTRDRRPDILKIAPTHLSSILETAADPRLLLPREVLILGGEALPWSLVQRVRALDPALRIVNHYGPTETTVGVSYHSIPAGSHATRSGWVPIGRPLPNVRAYVVDRHARPCPDGVPGELWVSGPQVALGYLGDPALTAAAFVEDPFDGASAMKVYRTGDYAMYDAEGNLCFLGRMDDQVKIRGFRVEPAEIRAAVMAIPGISDAAVVPRSLGGNQVQLVAYYVTEEGNNLEAHQLVERVSRQLPAHMIPAVFSALDALPRLPHGKVDRESLPAPEPAALPDLEDGDAPEGAVEEELVRIWEELLGRRPIGRNDIFFDLGGHSLLALRLLDRIKRQLNARIPVRILFEKPTVAGLAKYMASKSAK